jgi:hypothetical protein
VRSVIEDHHPQKRWVNRNKVAVSIGMVLGICLLSKVSIADNSYYWDDTDYSDTVTVERCKVRGEAIAQKLRDLGKSVNLSTSKYTVWMRNINGSGVDVFIGCIERKKVVVFVIRGTDPDNARQWGDWTRNTWKQYDLIQ